MRDRSADKPGGLWVEWAVLAPACWDDPWAAQNQAGAVEDLRQPQVQLSTEAMAMVTSAAASAWMSGSPRAEKW